MNHIFLFLIWPFGGLLTSLKNRRAIWAKNLFWLFCIYFGYTFVIPDTGPDSARYAQKLLEFSRSELTFANLVNALYSEETSYIDILQPLITFIVSRFTDNPRILFAVFGLIFGYFYSRNLWFIIERLKVKVPFILFLFILTFALFNPIWYINGFRMYIAAQIFLFGTLPFLVDGNKKRLIWSFLSVFAHFSFTFPVLVLSVYILLGNRIVLFFWFFIIASFITELNLQTIREFLSYLPDIFRIRIESYTKDTYVAGVAKAAAAVNWYVPYSTKVIGWVIYAFSIIIFFKAKKTIKARIDLLNLFCFSLFMYGFAKIFSNIPSGGRFLTIANLFMFAFLIWFLSEFGKQRIYKILKLLSLPCLFLYIIVTIRIGLGFMGILTIIGNPFIAAFIDENVPLIYYIKQVF